jgi:hypothetical protein
MPPPPLTISIGLVTVTFVWTGDRWSHEVVIRDAGTWQSVEGSGTGTGDDRWPASPVLVELSAVETPRGPAVLGVGRAGRSHFSASVAQDPDHPGQVRFEVACRLAEPPLWLGSTYASAGGTATVRPKAATPAELPATVQWAYSFGAVGLAPCEPSGNRSDS